MNNEMLTKIVEDFESVVYKVLDATPEDILPYTPEEPVIDDELQSSQGESSQGDPSLSNVDEEEGNISRDELSQGNPSQDDPSLSNVDVDEEEGNISQRDSPPTEVKFNELLNIDMDNNEQVQELQEIVNREQEKVIKNLEEKNSIDEFLNF